MSYITTIIAWVKANKLSSILILAVVYFLFSGIGSTPRNAMMSKSSDLTPNLALESRQTMSAPGSSAKYQEGMMPPVVGGGAAPANAPRLTIQDFYFSLLVNNVKQTTDAIKDKVMSVGGFIVESKIDNPAGDSTGSITMRVPRAQTGETIAFLRKQATEVKAETSTGTDVTDQFYDIEARLTVLNENKTRFEEIMRRATAIADILNVQKEIINLQDQIDSLQGQKKYIDEASKYTRITLNLAVRDTALPTNPNASWTIKGVFKEAFDVLVRILVVLATAVIYVAVFAIIWIPALIIYTIIKRRSNM